MAECRFHGECRLAGGLSPRMCDGKGMVTTLSAVGYVYNRCGRFSPMPDVQELMALADEMDELCGPWHDCGEHYARRVREACGEAKA